MPLSLYAELVIEDVVGRNLIQEFTMNANTAGRNVGISGNTDICKVER